MLKISTVESPREVRLVVEGKLESPWVGELKHACEKAEADLRGRELVVEIGYVIAISLEGETVLLDLMKQRVKVCSRGAFTKHVLKDIAKRARRDLLEENK